MKKVFLTIFVMLLFIGCGGGVSTTTKSDSSRLNATNYIDIAQYYFIKQYSHLGDDKIVRNRIYPAQKDENLENIFKVDAVTPLNQSVKELVINYNDRDILLVVEGELVNIKYLENNELIDTTSLTIEEFKVYGRDM